MTVLKYLPFLKGTYTPHYLPLFKVCKEKRGEKNN